MIFPGKYYKFCGAEGSYFIYIKVLKQLKSGHWFVLADSMASSSKEDTDCYKCEVHCDCKLNPRKACISESVTMVPVCKLEGLIKVGE